MDTVKTDKGSILPLMNLKGKPYMQVAHRIVWLNDDCASFQIRTEHLVLTDEQTVCKARIEIYDVDGKLVKLAEGTKRETKKDFPDHTEKAETGSIGRALASLGYGTAYALADLDEGERIVDAPVVNTKTIVNTNSSTSTQNNSANLTMTNVGINTDTPTGFKRPTKEKEVTKPASTSNGGF